MPQQTTIRTLISSVLSAALDLGSARSEVQYDRSVVLDNGTGANQADQVWHDTRTLTTGANETLDLNGGLTNALGASVTFTKVKQLYIRNKGTTALTIGNAGGGVNAWATPFGAATHTIKVQPGGELNLIAPDAAGFAVTPGTGDLLKIENAAGASCDYDIVIIGVN